MSTNRGHSFINTNYKTIYICGQGKTSPYQRLNWQYPKSPNRVGSIKHTYIMGFWKTFFSTQQCKNCGSYNTENINFHDLSNAEQNEYWRVVGNIRPGEVYRCEDCHQITIDCGNGRKYWTHPID